MTMAQQDSAVLAVNPITLFTGTDIDYTSLQALSNTVALIIGIHSRIFEHFFGRRELLQRHFLVHLIGRFVSQVNGSGSDGVSDGKRGCKDVWMDDKLVMQLTDKCPKRTGRACYPPR